MEDNSSEPKPYAVALRRFLISSSSSSASSPARGEGAAAADAHAELHTSSVSSDSSASSSAATSARNYSNHSTPPQTRLQHTVEKAAPPSPSPAPQQLVTASAASKAQLRRRSGSSDSVESRDSVDALASSAFQDSRSAHRTLAQQLLSLSGTKASAVHKEAVPTEEEVDKLSLPVQDIHEGEESREEPPLPIIRSSADAPQVDGAESDADFFSPITATEAGSPVHEEQEAQEAGASTRFALHQQTPPSIVLAPPPLPATSTEQPVDEAESTNTTTSSSRHQVGVWKAIYGKEKWAGPRRSYSREGSASDDIATSNADDRQEAAATVGASSSSPSAAAGAARHADSSQWAATRRTALEVLRAQLTQSEANSPHAGEARAQHSRGSFLVEAPSAAAPPVWEEPTLLEAVVQSGADEEAEEDEAGQEPSFEVVEVHEMPPLAAEVVEEVAQEDSSTVEAADPPFMVGRRRSAEEVLEDLFRGLPTHAATSAEVGATPSGSTAPSHRLVVRPALSTDVSGISPIKNEAPSLLAELYDTPEMRPARGLRQPADATTAVAELGARQRVVDQQLQTPTLSSPMEKLRGRLGPLSEGREGGEYTTDLSAMDFKTAQTAPTSTSSSEASIATDASAERGAVYADERPYDLHSEEGDQSDVQPPLPLPKPATALRVDRKVSVFPATAANTWDAGRVPRWRLKEQQQQEETQPTAASTTPAVAGGNADRTPATFRQERIRTEMRAHELAECTFQPTLSPGTRAMVRLAQEREIERTLDEIPSPAARGAATASGAAGRSVRGNKTAATRIASASAAPAPSSLDPRKLKATLQNVYERLYPVELAAAASRRQILDQEMEYRRLAREELIELRRKAGVVVRHTGRTRGALQARDAFDTFLSSVLQADSVPTSSGRVLPTGAAAAVVDTSYMSPMAVALQEEKAVRRKSNTRREAELHSSHQHDAADSVHHARSRTGAGGDSGAQVNGTPRGSSAAESFRIALFDEFLLRQNAYFFNRTRSVRDLERQLTPAFTPSTTQKSARLVQDMVSRSLLNESMGPETSSTIAQRQRQHIPVSAGLVAPHLSPYKDPCTFHPQLSPSARAAKAAEKSQRDAMHGPAATPTAHRKAFFDRLYGDHARIAKERSRAQEAAAVEEMAGVTFTPQVNGGKNVQARSMLDPKNYGHYQEALQRKRLAQEEQRQAQLSRSEEAEEVVCTFRPQTTKTPAYISKMAKNFGVLRRQDTEF